MRDRPIDPSALVDGDTPGDFDAEKAIERWDEIRDHGHPLGPDSEHADTESDRQEGNSQ